MTEEVLASRDLTCTTKMIYLYLIELDKQGAIISIKNYQLADKLGISLLTVKIALKKLDGLGMIKRDTITLFHSDRGITRTREIRLS